jgi:CheY-like chemotaxis protein
MEPEPLNKTTLKALVVDDEDSIVEVLAEIMEAIGVIPIKAKDGQEAWEKFEKEKPQIVFSDIYMPRLNGMMLLRKIRTLDRKIPVILFTGYFHYKQMLKQDDIKPDNFLEKPLKVKEIIEIMLSYFPQLRKE